MMLYTDVILEHSDVQMARTGCDMGESENWGQPLSLVNRLAHVHEQPLRYPLTRILASPCVRLLPGQGCTRHRSCATPAGFGSTEWDGRLGVFRCVLRDSAQPGLLAPSDL